MRIPNHLYVAIHIHTSQVLGTGTNKAELIDNMNTWAQEFEIVSYSPDRKAKIKNTTKKK